MPQMLMYVGLGRVRIEDKLGNAEADAADDLGRRHQSELLVDAWRVLLNARNHWYLIMLQLHRFMIAVGRVAVNHDGRVSPPDPLVWDQGSKKKQRRTDISVNVDLASLPGPPGFLSGPVAAWPHCVSILCKFTFLGYSALACEC